MGRTLCLGIDLGLTPDRMGFGVYGVLVLAVDDGPEEDGGGLP